MKKLIATLILATSISGMAATNINVNPVINFNPNINVNPTITSNNDNTNTNTNDNKSSLKLDKLHSPNTATPEVKKVLIKLQEVDKKMTALEKKEINFEELAKNFGKEASSQALLKKVKEDIENKRKGLVNEQVKLIKKIKKVEGKAKGVILFKYDSIRKQWAKMIKDKNPLVPRLIEAANFIKKNFNKPIVLTEVLRTQAQQNKIYGKKRGKKSWHQFYAAADLRVRIYTPSEIVQIVSFLKKFEKENALRLTVLYHDIGLASHIHFQFRAKAKK